MESKFGKEGLVGLQVVGGESLQKTEELIVVREDNSSRWTVMLMKTMTRWIAFVWDSDRIYPNQGILGYS